MLAEVRNYYVCPDDRCAHHWVDDWDCPVDDNCPDCGGRASPYQSNALIEKEPCSIDQDAWGWISIMDRFQDLADRLSEPPDDHAALAAELHSIAEWIGSWGAKGQHDTNSGVYIRFANYPEGKESAIFGPFDYAQIRYEELVVGPSDEPAAFYHKGRWESSDFLNLDGTWTDIIIFADYQC